MKLEISPTEEFAFERGLPYRIWKGADEDGIAVLVLVRAVSPQTHDEEVARRYENALLPFDPQEVPFDD